jgi:membrane protease subunit (stomatin/prohibitin family)
LRADDSALANAVRLEEWFRRNGAYNYRVEDELRGLYAEAGDWQKSQTFVDDIFKHSFMDAFQLDQQMMTGSPQKAIRNLLHSAEACSQRKFLRSACLIKAGMLSAGLGRHSDAQRFLYQVASDHDSALSAYSSYATQQLQTLH